MFRKIFLLALALTVHSATCIEWDSDLIAQYGKIDIKIVVDVHDRILAAISTLHNRSADIDTKFDLYQQRELSIFAAIQSWIESEMKSLQERGDDVREKGLDMIEEFQPVIEEIESCKASDVENAMEEFQAKVNAHISFYETFMEDIMNRFRNCIDNPYLDCELLVRSEFETLKQGPKDLYRVNADGASLSLIQLDLNLCTVKIIANNEAKFQELVNNLKNLDL